MQFHRFPIQGRQSAGQAQADGTNQRIGIFTELVRARAEQLRFSVKLDVHLETDDSLPGGVRLVFYG